MASALLIVTVKSTDKVWIVRPYTSKYSVTHRRKLLKFILRIKTLLLIIMMIIMITMM